MRNVASFFKQLLAARFASSDPGRALIVLGGIPEKVLGAIYDDVTHRGASCWGTPVGPTSIDVPVLWISDADSYDPPRAGPLQCSRCTWDFAVNARSSCPLLLVLVSPSRAAEIPESISNAASTVGFVAAPSSGRALRKQLALLGISRDLSTEDANERAITSIIAGLFDGSTGIPIDERLEGVWQQIDNALGESSRGGDMDVVLAASFGLPYDAARLSGKEADKRSDVLARLGSFLSEAGIKDGITKLKSTAASVDNLAQEALDQFQAWMFSHTSVSSAASFERAARWHFRQSIEPQPWWTQLSASSLEAMLDELGAVRRTERVNIMVTNSVGDRRGPDDQPWLVKDAAELSIAPRGAGDLSGARVLLGSIQIEALDGPAPHTCSVVFPDDSGKAVHSVRVEGPNVKVETAKVVSLAKFEVHGFLEFPDARKNPGPMFRDGKWTQDVTLARGGATRVRVHLGGPATAASIKVNEQAAIAAADGEAKTLDLESGAIVTFVTNDGNGVQIALVELAVAVDSAEESAAQSYFAALVQAHRTGRNFVSPDVPDNGIRRIEVALLSSAESWRPIQACFTEATVLDLRSINWASPKLGNLNGVLDVRPPISPPSGLIAAREAVRAKLLSEGRPIPDVDLGGLPEYKVLSNQYLTAYLDWFSTVPNEAVWFDVLALHAAVFDEQSGAEVPRTEPTAMLVSPLHPLRFAWQCEAQRVLKDSIEHPCPTAGLMAFQSVPDAGAWRLGSSTASYTSFFGRACRDGYWSVLWNSNAFADAVATTAVERVLAWLGLAVSSVTPGFDAAQVRHALREVSGILSARSTLRCSIAGTPASPAALTDGVFDWVGEHFPERENMNPPDAVEIYDARESGRPSDEQLAFLSRIAEGKVRWFTGNKEKLDLAIIDQLSVGVPSPVATDLRTAIGPGALTRIRLRSDTDQARRLLETRVAAPLPINATELDRAVQAFEARAAESSTRASAIESQPNQQAIGHRLQAAQLVAVTSGQVDLACLTRGIESQEGYLWDYEIPSLLDANQQAGYYLIARPEPGMKQSIEAALEHLTQRPPVDSEVQGVLREISRRGIPVLKRVSEGGSHARGELGALIAARFLQDVFRPNPSRAGIPVHAGGVTTMLMPVDPFQDVFAEIGKRLAPQSPVGMRPDFIAFAIRREGDHFALKITPIEVKYRAVAGLSEDDREHAYQQAKSFADLLRSALISPPNTAWQVGGSALLAECVDYAFRLHSSQEIHALSAPEWADLHAQCIRHILARSARIEIHPSGVVIAIQDQPTGHDDYDNDGITDCITLGPADTASIYQTGIVYDQGTTELIRQAQLDFAEQSEVTQPSPKGPAADIGVVLPAAELAPRVGAPTTNLAHVTEHEAPAEPVNSAREPSAPSVAPVPLENTSPMPAVARPIIGSSGISPEIRAEVDAAFEGFVGNSEAISALKRDALFARLQQPIYLKKAYLFTGSASSGKTTLATRLGNAIGVPVVRLDGRSEPLRSRAGLFDAINAVLIDRNQRPVRRSLGGARCSLDYPPFLLFIDEAHLVPGRVQESLLTMVEADDRTAVIDAQRTASVRMATFVFATTRASDMDGPLKSRCDEIQLQDYSLEEVAEITRRQYPDWPSDIHKRLAVLGRRVPRISLELARSLQTEIIVNGNESTTVDEHLTAVARSKRIDSLGLTPNDTQYLSVLRQQRRAVGRDMMVNLLQSVDRNRIIEEIEPYLRILQFIRFSQTGREITREGVQYLDSRRC